MYPNCSHCKNCVCGKYGGFYCSESGNEIEDPSETFCRVFVWEDEFPKEEE